MVGFLITHLFTNVKSVFYPDWFIESVNQIHALPYLLFIEITVLALPFFLHMYWGLFILKTAVSNSSSTDGTTPSLKEYPKNHAYTWQRITSWILLVAIIAHVIHMRILNYPDEGENFGVATSILLKETFSNIWFCLLYTVFVLAASFHAFNGLWTSMITWGVTLSLKAQRVCRWIVFFLMILVSFWGLATIWYR
jgi:succinate dehydrogenase/fumarate reductase cytochrome b subunit (b558 family)